MTRTTDNSQGPPRRQVLLKLQTVELRRLDVSNDPMDKLNTIGMAIDRMILDNFDSGKIATKIVVNFCPPSEYDELKME